MELESFLFQMCNHFNIWDLVHLQVLMRNDFMCKEYRGTCAMHI